MVFERFSESCACLFKTSALGLRNRSLSDRLWNDGYFGGCLEPHNRRGGNEPIEATVSRARSDIGRGSGNVNGGDNKWGERVQWEQSTGQGRSRQDRYLAVAHGRLFCRRHCLRSGIQTLGR